MNLDNQKMWMAMNCIENAVALGYNDLILTTANKTTLDALFRMWVSEWQDRKVEAAFSEAA